MKTLSLLFTCGMLTTLLCSRGHAETVSRYTPPANANTEAIAQALNDAWQQNSSFEDIYAAQVWLLDMSTRIRRFPAAPKNPIPLLKQIHRLAIENNISPQLVLSVIEVESHFDQFAVSKAGAQGLMQVMPFWKAEIGRKDDNLTQIGTNLRYGTTILRYYLDRKKNNQPAALAAYNGNAQSRIYANKVNKAFTEHWQIN